MVMSYDVEFELEKNCPRCGGALLPRVIGCCIGDGQLDRELTDSAKERGYYIEFRRAGSQRLVVCSRCSWAKSI